MSRQRDSPSPPRADRLTVFRSDEFTGVTERKSNDPRGKLRKPGRKETNDRVQQKLSGVGGGKETRGAKTKFRKAKLAKIEVANEIP